MKYSKQRELIYKTVLEHPIHPSADTVYAMVRQQLPSISLGTVYRNLNLLSEQGALLKISMPNVSDHFDGRTDAHCHMLCERCGGVFDIDAPGLETLMERMDGTREFKVTGCHLYFTGICGTCLKRPDCAATEPR